MSTRTEPPYLESIVANRLESKLWIFCLGIKLAWMDEQQRENWTDSAASALVFHWTPNLVIRTEKCTYKAFSLSFCLSSLIMLILLSLRVAVIALVAWAFHFLAALEPSRKRNVIWFVHTGRVREIAYFIQHYKGNFVMSYVAVLTEVKFIRTGVINSVTVISIPHLLRKK